MGIFDAVSKEGLCSRVGDASVPSLFTPSSRIGICKSLAGEQECERCGQCSLNVPVLIDQRVRMCWRIVDIAETMETMRTSDWRVNTFWSFADVAVINEGHADHECRVQSLTHQTTLHSIG